MIRTLLAAFRCQPLGLQRRWFALAPITLGVAVMEAVGTALILLLIRLVAAPDSAPDIVYQVAAELSIPADSLLTFIGLSTAAFFILKSFARLFEAWFRSSLSAEAYSEVSSGLLARYLFAPYSLHLRRNSADLIQIARDRASDLAYVVLNSGVALLSEVLVALVVLAILVRATPFGALAVAGVLGGFLWLLLFATQRRHTQIGRDLHRAARTLLSSFHQSLGGIKEVKVFGRETFFVQRTRQALDRLATANRTRLTIEQAPRLSVETVFVAGLALLVALGPAERDERLATSLGALAYGALRLLPSIHMVVYYMNRISQGEGPVETVVQDWQSYPSAPPPAVPARPFRESIRLERVSLTYEGAHKPSLSEVDLAIRRGEWVGVVGPTGAGKSSLIDILIGLLTPTEGRILIDGRPLEDDVRGWQAQVGYVPQNIHLIDDTIRRNIALGVPDAEIDEIRLAEAVRDAQLDPFLAGQPNGLDTVVGERGVRISGGERQRVAIARALYRGPAVLVFDEATSALDNRTERALTATIESLRGDHTLILIAHRLSTVEHCDRLLFLKDGRLAGEGDFQTLMAENEAFRKMASATTR